MVKQWWAIIDVMNLMTQSGSCIDMTMIWVIYEIVYAQSVRKDWRTKYDMVYASKGILCNNQMEMCAWMKCQIETRRR